MEANTSNALFNKTESLDDFNKRYADALLPITVVLITFVLVGIPGNVLVLVIFIKKYANSNFRTSVVSLAVVDLITCSSLIPLEIMKTRSYFFFPYPATCTLKCFLDMCSRSATSLMLMFICIDRYKKVCRPLSPQITPSKTLKIVVILAIVSFILAVPALIMCSVAPMNTLDIYGSNIIIQQCSAEEKYTNSIVRIIYKYAMSFLLVTIVISLVVFYILILRTIIIKSTSCIETSGSLRNNTTAELELDTKSPQSPVFSGNSGPNKEQKVSNVGTAKFTFSASHGQNSRHSSAKSSIMSTSTLSSNSTRRRLSSIFGRRARPYKTLIWFVLTIIFLVTNVLFAVMSFWSTKHYWLSPSQLAGFVAGYRLYFINNIVNPVVYVCIDRRFNKSCKQLLCRGKA